MAIKFYSLKPEDAANKPSDVSISELIQIANCDAHFVEEISRVSQRDLDALLVTPQSNPLRWERVLSGAITAITGKIPEREEVKIGRQLFERLNRKIRRSLSLTDVFGFFPYVLSGFKINLNGIEGNDTNSLDSLVLFTEKCFSGSEIDISSYLCAHKESREKGRDKLRPSVKLAYANRAINLMRGIIRNSRSTFGSVRLHQFKGNPEGMNALFPQVFLKYYKEGLLSELKNTLDQHYLQLKTLCEENSEERLVVEIEDASKTYQRAEDSCLETFGSGWRELYPSMNYGSFKPSVEKASEALRRLLRLEKIEGVSQERDNTILRAIEIFMQNQEANVTGKAALENMFYFTWGRDSGAIDGVAIGLDVDHEPYQIQSFSQGYTGSSLKRAPILYARRRGDGDLPNKKGLHNLSIRQFWR